MRSARGFTLIEILVAMAVFLAGMSGILALLSTALVMHREGLALGALVDDFDGLVAELQREVSAGQHWNAVEGRWMDVGLAQRPGRGVYSVDFVAERGNEAEGTLLALLRVASHASRLAASRAIPVLLQPGPSLAQRAAAWRARVPPPPDGL